LKTNSNPDFAAKNFKHMLYRDFQEPSLSGQENHNMALPQPGEIWELSQDVFSPLVFSKEEQKALYSEEAQLFLKGHAGSRYTMIVGSPESPSDDRWQTLSVMVFSKETRFLSTVDLLIPAQISGLEQDLLAQTWHVLPMLKCNLSQPVGQRLSRQIYDLLLTVGDHYHALTDRSPGRQKLKQAGLKIGTLDHQHPEIQTFHRQETSWSDVLSVPLAAYLTYRKSIRFTHSILNEALQLERDFKEPSKICVNLSQWVQNIFESGWQTIEMFWNAQGTPFAIATRSLSPDGPSDPQQIAVLIDQLASVQDEHQRQRAAKQLGDIASIRHPEAVRALMDLLRTTQNDETLWSAVESLWRIDPGNSAAGVRRVRLIDWGMQIVGEAVALAVALVPRENQSVNVLLQVYPTGNNPYLPPNLKLILLDPLGQALREITARQTDVYIQLKLSGYPGEQFSVKITFGTASITEDFSL
jgi:Protein of unknown function (DUF1822)